MSTYRVDTRRPVKTEAHAHECLAAHAATEVGQEMTKDEAATMADVMMAAAAVAVFLAGIGALLLILNSLFGVLA